MTNQPNLAAEVVRVVNEFPLGIMVTTDSQGLACPRWMGTAAVSGSRKIYTLSGKQGRKVEQIKANPQVSWMFNTPNHSDVVTLWGKASIIENPMALQQVWDRLAKITQPYAMAANSDDSNLEMLTIETIVEKIEFLSPRLGIFKSIEVPDVE